MAISPSIRTLPLSDEAQELFSRAVWIVRQSPGDFALIADWLTKHYSESTLRAQCEREYRHTFAFRLWLLRRDAPTYHRRLAIQQGCKWGYLAWDTINEALHRGRRLFEGRPCIRQDRQGVTVDETNVHLVWRWEDEQYRERFREIKEERKAAKLSEHDLPEKPVWRLRRAVEELIKVGYPNGDKKHVEHSRKVVAIAALMMPEPLPMLGEFGAWTFASTLCLPDEPTGSWLDDAIAADCKTAEAGPYGVIVDLMVPRIVGREEVMFQRMPDEEQELVSWFPLDTLLGRLRDAVDELEAEQAKGRHQSGLRTCLARVWKDPVGSTLIAAGFGCFIGVVVTWIRSWWP